MNNENNVVEAHNKTKKINVFILGIISIAILMIAIVIYFVINPTFDLEKAFNLEKAFDDLRAAESYDVLLLEYEDTFNTGKYSLEEEKYFSIHFTEKFEYIEESNRKQKYYNYRGEYILSTEKDNGELVWYYRPFLLFMKECDYGDYFLDMLVIFDRLEYQKENDKYVANQISDNINEFIYEICDLEYYITDSNQMSELYEVAKIELEHNEDSIEKITLYLKNQSYQEITKKIVFNFSNINGVTPILPEEVQKSLEETTAGDWVGTYSYITVDSSGNAIKSTLTLTDEFDWFDGEGWEIDYQLYDSLSESYITKKNTYLIDENNFYIIDIWGEMIEKGIIKDNTIQLLDEKGNVKGIFVKE